LSSENVYNLDLFLAETLRSLRKSRGESRLTIAEVVGLTSTGTVGKWERGERLPSLAQALMLADHFQVSLDKLVGRISPEVEALTKLDLNAAISNLLPDRSVLAEAAKKVADREAARAKARAKTRGKTVGRGASKRKTKKKP